MDNMPDCDELKIDFRELDSDLITQFIAKKLLFILNLKNRLIIKFSTIFHALKVIIFNEG
jgi:hypothetical protein